MTFLDILRWILSASNKSGPVLPVLLSGCKNIYNTLFWRLHELMNGLIDHTISVDDVRSPEPLYSCIITQLDHILDPHDGDPREYIVARVALPHSNTPDAPPPSEPATPRHIGLVKLERCWEGHIPVEEYDKCGVSKNRSRNVLGRAHDAANVYGPSMNPVTGRRRTVLRSYGAPLPLVRLVVAACALRRLHVEACGDTHAHAWFARALWERLVPAGSADVVHPSDWRSRLAGRIAGSPEPPKFDDVLEGAEAEACRAIEDGALAAFAAARAKIAECLSPEGEWVSPEDQAKTVEDISDAVDAAVWGDFRDLSERKDPLMALANAEAERRLQANIARRKELAALPGEGQACARYTTCVLSLKPEMRTLAYIPLQMDPGATLLPYISPPTPTTALILLRSLMTFLDTLREGLRYHAAFYWWILSANKSDPVLPVWISGCKKGETHFWGLHELMNSLIDRTISVDDVRSPAPLYSCIVTQLDHILDPNHGDPREYIVAHVALPHPKTPDAPPPSEPGAPPLPIGLVKFERCWKHHIPVEQYDKCGCSRSVSRHMSCRAHDAASVYGPFLDPLTGRRRTILRSCRAPPVTLVRLVVAACALRRLHVEACGDTHAHAWFARALWERLVSPSSADVAYPPDWRTWLAGRLGGLLAASEPPKFDAVLEGAEAEACRAIEDGALGEFAVARAKIAERLSAEGEWASPGDQAQAVEDISDAVDAAVWGDFRDLDERKALALLAKACAEASATASRKLKLEELAALPRGEGQVSSDSWDMRGSTATGSSYRVSAARTKANADRTFRVFGYVAKKPSTFLITNEVMMEGVGSYEFDYSYMMPTPGG
ncbi:uncharacterized protein BXZ73DRAFT_77139 [Epithele typhae]|uniref:uncharacterized protein n=1 Tax=Epithele typhae TaxID=378194 RepID=UPI0020087991|nr:uncharacterized protein BXZ73DRAFT_77139 [Epithele typhae]KAH9934045.1 hypothetical protein BXZ73DRAFT_77139 [Epithele typhae]